MTLKQGTFIISLDFELHWGGFEKWPLENYRQYFMNTRKVIPEMLRLFEQSDVHVTWATVGMLFHTTRHSLEETLPTLQPSYAQRELSAYQYIEKHGIGNDEDDDPFHYAGSLVQRVLETPGQELASHTFAHYYCNEAGQTVEQFRADLRAAQLSAEKYGKRLRSLVFPRNQFNEEYLKACYEEGIVAVRDNPRDWFWNIRSTQHESMWKRLNRGLDAYFPVGKANTYPLGSIESALGLPLCIPASRLLRPYRPKEYFLNNLKISRIQAEMKRAAQQQQVYHLWWHPHNFGNYPQQSMDGLRRILDTFVQCREQHGMQSLSMGEVADLILKKA
ncbi:polysaccharide deacetylase family protein [Chryseolinea lacunae]|uniref:Polysaccharide deacetylase family protein n=1 Tax=Chryseolinea lacunae TaxID=2801331 RepID=A0ABS1KX16_9BACT|nr:polysaccharide deacetylase family protein [Chryseolinea lacunae]MBL0744018.1 polysaccharide deacetylase family protein [Chryseolinea lacunae]